MISSGSVSVVRTMRPSDLGEVRGIYRQSLEGGFFAELGDAFLEAYLGTYVTSPYGCALVADKGGAIVGFLLGTTNAGEHRAYVLAHERWRLLGRGVVALAVRPRLAVRFLRTRLARYARVVSTTAPPPSTSGVGVLAHIAVTGGARGHGLGASLESRFAAAAFDVGTPRLTLVTAQGDALAQDFYRKNGWKETGTRVDRDAKVWTAMEKTP